VLIPEFRFEQIDTDVYDFDITGIPLESKQMLFDIKRIVKDFKELN
jgi:hypothetical protein